MAPPDRTLLVQAPKRSAPRGTVAPCAASAQRSARPRSRCGVFFAGGASGTDATAPLGTAAVLVGGGSRRRLVARSRRAPAARPCRHRGGRRRDRSRRLDGPQHLVVDRRRPLLGRSRERHRHARLRRRRPRRRRASRPAVAIACSPARRGARRSPRLGPARQGDSGARPRRRRQHRAPEGIDRLLECPRSPRGRGARGRPLAPRLGPRALRPAGRRLAALRGHDRDPADAVARGPDRRGGRRRPGALAVRAPCRGRAARAPCHRPRDHASRAGRSRDPLSSRTAPRGRIASRTGGCSAC